MAFFFRKKEEKKEKHSSMRMGQPHEIPSSANTNTCSTKPKKRQKSCIANLIPNEVEMVGEAGGGCGGGGEKGVEEESCTIEALKAL